MIKLNVGDREVVSFSIQKITGWLKVGDYDFLTPFIGIDKKLHLYIWCDKDTGFEAIIHLVSERALFFTNNRETRFIPLFSEITPAIHTYEIRNRPSDEIVDSARKKMESRARECAEKLKKRVAFETSWGKAISDFHGVGYAILTDRHYTNIAISDDFVLEEVK